MVAFRAVVERRQQIGMLRALGFQRSRVALAFLIEAAFVVVLGVLIGTALGLVTAYNLFRSEGVGPAGAALWFRGCSSARSWPSRPAWCWP